MRDFDQVRSFLSSAGPLAFLDLPGCPSISSSASFVDSGMARPSEDIEYDDPSHN